MMDVKSIRDISLEERAVLMRLDLNCPLSDGEVTNDARIRAALPTIKYALEQGARLAIASHLGRPKGQVNAALSMESIGARLSELLEMDIVLADNCVGDGVKGVLQNLRSGQIVMLENLRFHEGETKNDPEFARRLAAPFEVFVNDAFGACHRAHASVVGVLPFVQDVGAGLLLEKEVDGLSRILHEVERPFVAVIGGAKVSDKVGILEALLNKVQTICIGGAMAYTFLQAQGVKVGTSRVEADKLHVARKILKGAEARNVTILLPSDHVVANEFQRDAQAQIVTSVDIPDESMGLDIGPVTRRAYAAAIEGAGSLLWNGPMGVFEWDAFAAGTNAVAAAVADCDGYTVVGGGDSVSAIEKAGVAERINHVSTGGGASLEFLERGNLPGLEVLGG